MKHEPARNVPVAAAVTEAAAAGAVVVRGASARDERSRKRLGRDTSPYLLGEGADQSKTVRGRGRARIGRSGASEWCGRSIGGRDGVGRSQR